jgi:endonuclease/exonuclease/phosphatase family metal-dependent hydrolase
MLLLALAAAALGCAPVTLKVLVFNVEYGGALVEFAKTVEVVERAAPDVVLVEEAWGHIPRLARGLEWTEYDVRHQVIGRRPLLDVAEADGRFLYAELSPGCVVAVANVHLPSDPDPPDEMPDAAAVEAGMEIERRSRLQALEPTLAALRPLLAAGIPVLLGGDFNAPSHLDDPRFPWPVSRAIAAAGLRDVWREAHPEPKTHPGFTWWAARPQVAGWNPSPKARHVRIDQLHAGGTVAVKDVRIVGEAGRAGVDIGVVPWPSDHRALLATLEITPAPAPPLVAAWPARVPRGDTLRVRARGVDTGARVVVVPAGTDPRTVSATRAAGLSDLTYETRDLVPGAYEVSLLDRSGRLASTAAFWVASAEPRPSVTLGRARIKAGEAIDVRWTEAPGNRWDWVGVYAEGVDPQSDGAQPLVWRHTRATVTGAARLDAHAEGDGWPLHPGKHKVCLFEDDAYVPLACAGLMVEP